MAVDISFSLPMSSQVLCQSSPQEHQLREGEGSAALSTASCPVLPTVSASPPVCLIEGMDFKPRH